MPSSSKLNPHHPPAVFADAKSAQFPRQGRAMLIVAVAAAVFLVGSAGAQEPAAETPAAEQPPAESAAPEEQPQPDGQQEQDLPTLDEMLENLPAAAELLRNPPVDWLVLTGERQEVLVVSPVYPRPDTLEIKEKAIDEVTPALRAAADETRAELQRKREEMHFLSVELPGQTDRTEYKLHIDRIDRIIYHEDLMLLRVDKLIEQRQPKLAYEVLFRLERERPDWPGLQDRHDSLLLAEAKSQIEEGRSELALVYLHELRSRSPQYPGLDDLTGGAFDNLISQAAEEADYREARYYLNRLQNVTRNHPVAARWTDRLLADSNELVRQANDAFAAKRYAHAAELVDQAAFVWPTNGGLRDDYRRIAGRYQRLKVGVLGLASDPTTEAPSAYFLPTEANQRHTRLTEVKLFEVENVDRSAHYRTRFFEMWEPTDLGRQTVFTLRPGRSFWECHPVVTAPVVVESLAARLNPRSPAYDERFSTFVRSLRVLSPFEFEVQFSRVPLNIESLFTVPVMQRSASVVVSTASSENGTVEPSPDDRLLSSRFVRHEQNDNTVGYRRAQPEPDGVPQHHVAEVVERKYPSHEDAIQGLLRGEVSVLAHAHPALVDQLADDERFFVQKYAMPVTHVLQFNPQNRVLANREIRRALFYAIDRKRLLSETILRGSGGERGRVVTGPFPTNNYAYNSLIPPLDSDPTLALTLTIAAKKQLQQEIPELRMVCAPDPVARAGAAAVIEQWKRVGITVRLIESAEQTDGSADWDIVYRAVRMADPFVELWPFLSLNGEVTVESIMHLPAWLRQEVFALETAGDWNTAVRILQDLHRHLWAEVQFIPLWEIDDYIVIRRESVGGFDPQPLHTYQNIERWIVQPWYSTESL